MPLPAATPRCGFLAALAAALLGGTIRAGEDDARPPNIVILLADDLGYGDLGCYGHATIATPSLDRMAAEGLRFTQFYAAEGICTPSRAGLLTGRLAVRSGMCSDTRPVLLSDSTGGLPDGELTIAELLKEKDYATACVGKWHLGHRRRFSPVTQGFDRYFGLPYSNDMQPDILMRDTQVIEHPVAQATLTKRYTAEALAFIREQRAKPFFLYLAYTAPHTPLFPAAEFKGKSRRGPYGDVVEELDWSVGRVLDTLRELELERHTLVFFTSDNGPWIGKKAHGGSAGALRGGKTSTWEGGMRAPAIAWWPDTVPAGRTTTALASSLDLLVTISRLAGVEPPRDRPLDSVDIRDVLLGRGPSPRGELHYYRGGRLMALRSGRWKAHFLTQQGLRQKDAVVHDPPLLFDLEVDPSESRDVAQEHPDVVAAIRELASRHSAGVVAPPSQLELH